MRHMMGRSGGRHSALAVFLGVAAMALMPILTTVGLIPSIAEATDGKDLTSGERAKPGEARGLGGPGGGGPSWSAGGAGPAHNAGQGQCLPVEERQQIQQRIDANRARLGLPAAEGGLAGLLESQRYAFYPMGGTIDDDLFHYNFVDLDLSNPGILDFACTPFTYDGHSGIDTPLRSFDEQIVGVPVYSALDGVVIDTHDGEPDMNTVPQGQPSNYVIIDHGFGQEAWYLHLKNGSVAANIGDFVKAGQQIGKTASSGNSSGPHLHFTTIDAGSVYEPFAGPCRPGQSGFLDQNEGTTSTYLIDFGITTEDLFQVPGLPFALPRDAQVAQNTEYIYYWFQFVNLTQASTWQVKFVRPNGTISYDSGAQPFDNPDTWRGGWMFFYWWLPFVAPELTTTPGTWHIDWIINGQMAIHAPFEAVAAVNPSFNRRPQNIALSLDPAAPTADDVIFCRVNSSVLLDDLDYDMVRYHYVWKVNGGTVRDVISAAKSDAIPRNTAKAGDQLQCQVTSNDGVANGTLASITISLPQPGGACPSDLVPSNTVDIDDLFDLLGDWGPCPE